MYDWWESTLQGRKRRWTSSQAKLQGSEKQSSGANWWNYHQLAARRWWSSLVIGIHSHEKKISHHGHRCEQVESNHAQNWCDEFNFAVGSRQRPLYVILLDTFPIFRFEKKNKIKGISLNKQRVDMIIRSFWNTDNLGKIYPAIKFWGKITIIRWFSILNKVGTLEVNK